MSFDFVEKVMCIGSANTSPIQFYKKGFNLGGSGSQPSWQDIILSGNTALTLTNALANGLNYLKLFGGTEQRNLPSGYTQVEYLESDGAQYIDTGYAPNVNTEVKINFSTTTLPSTDAYMFHSTDNGSARMSLAITQHLVFFGDDLNVSGNRIVLPVFTANTAYNITVNKNTTIVNGTEYNFTHTSVTLPTMGSIGLFGTRTGNLKCQGRVKSFSCNENNVLRINLIPCRRNSDNVLGMYDTVTDTFLTNAGTGTFTAGADVTAPSPDYPMDIVSNNGVVKARHHSGLPLEYQRVEYLESTGTQYIDTGYIANGGMAFEAKAAPGGTRGTYTFWIGSIGVSTENLDGTRNAVGVNGNVLSWQKGRVYSGAGFVLSNNNPVVVYMNTIGNAFEGKANGTTLNVNPSSIQQTLTGLTTTVKIGYSDYSSAARAMTIYYFKMWNNNYELIQNLIPCRRNSDNVLGMYDTVSQTFLTNQGTGTFTAGNTVSDPIEIYTDGTTETVEVHGRNLFDVNNVEIQESTAISADGSLVSNSGVDTCITFIPVKPNTTYTISGDVLGTDASFFRLAQYKADKTFISRSEDSIGRRSSYTFTTGANTYYIRFHYIKSASLNTYQLEQGSTATAYEPYFNGGTATAENLFKIGDYKDVQEVLAGDVTRNIGVKVLDGTENWNAHSTLAGWFQLSLSSCYDIPYNAYCTHYTYNNGSQASPGVWFSTGRADIPTSRIIIADDVRFPNTRMATEFKAWLAQQYANGTPVIIVYPLATATTKTVTAQPLTTQAGTNIVEITQASIDNLGLEVSYKATV